MAMQLSNISTSSNKTFDISSLNFSSRATKDFKSVLSSANETKSFKKDSHPVSKNNNNFKQSNNINKTKNKVNSAKGTNDSDDLNDEKAVKDKIKNAAEEKLQRISELLNSDDIQTNTAKQDELLKLLFQLQSLIENKDFVPEQNIMNQINELMNNPVLDLVKQQDSLMKDVTSQIQSDSVKLVDNSKQVNNVDTDADENESNSKNQNIVDADEINTDKDNSDMVKQSNAFDSSTAKENVIEKKAENNANTVKSENSVNTEKIKSSIENGRDKLEAPENKLSLREASKEKLGLRKEYKLEHEKSDYGINAEVSAQDNEIGTNVADKKDVVGVLNNKVKTLSSTMKSTISSEILKEVNESSNSVPGKSNLLDSLKGKINETAESVEVKEKTVTIKEAFKEFNQNQESNDNSQANIQASVRVDNQNIMIRNTFNLKTTAPAVNYKEVLEQIKTGTKVVVNDNTTEMTIKLNPENLGKLSLKLVTENGLVSAKFVAESQQVKEIIESNFNELKQSFMNQGINIGNLSVSVGSEGDGLRQQMFNSFNGKRKNGNSTNREDSIFAVNGYEEEEAEQNNSNNIYPESSVNYIV